ncbi:MAG: hypothetical protein CM15mP79_1770 [Methanobacteriota archaeon]|nr:MAG: hypothetical protein CM15mP79_1770 [Euryarchaeota archaeon]
MFTRRGPRQTTSALVKGRIILATAHRWFETTPCPARLTSVRLSLVVVDEAHHARGQHAYAQVADLVREMAASAVMLGATASGHEQGRHQQGWNAGWGVERWSVHGEDAGLAPYTVDLSVASEHLSLPETLLHLIAPLAEEERDLADRLRRQGYPDTGHITAAM